MSAAELHDEMADRGGFVYRPSPLARKAHFGFRVLQRSWLAWPIERFYRSATLAYALRPLAAASDPARFIDTFP